MANRSIDQILDFWFPADSKRANALWWGKNAELDAEIKREFEETLRAAVNGDLVGWEQSARGRLALILLMDQMSRNIYRGDAQTYAADHLARALTKAGLDLGHDRDLNASQRMFFYMPLEHSEELVDQDRCVELFRALARDVAENKVEHDPDAKFDGYTDYAIRHRDIVARFGRFPHRNAILSRPSTPEELEFLTQPGSSF